MLLIVHILKVRWPSLGKLPVTVALEGAEIRQVLVSILTPVLSLDVELLKGKPLQLIAVNLLNFVTVHCLVDLAELGGALLDQNGDEEANQHHDCDGTSDAATSLVELLALDVAILPQDDTRVGSLLEFGHLIEDRLNRLDLVTVLFLLRLHVALGEPRFIAHLDIFGESQRLSSSILSLKGDESTNGVLQLPNLVIVILKQVIDLLVRCFELVPVVVFDALASLP